MKCNEKIGELTDEEFNSFYNDAKELLFSDKRNAKDKNPVAILTGGQPGAGKSGLVIKSRKDFEKAGINPVILDGDTYRGLYPNAEKIAKQYPHMYAEITDRATGKVMEKLIEYSIENGYNFIREGTLNSAEIVDQLLVSPRNYKVVIRLLATCREESILSCFERYILMKEKTGIGRFIQLQSHDKRYYQFPKTAKEQEKKGVEIEVYKRGVTVQNPILLYNNKHFNTRFSNFEEALKYGRNQSYMECRENILRRIANIRTELVRLGSNERSILNQLKEFEANVMLREGEEER